MYDKIDYKLDETYSRGQSVKTLENDLLVQRNGLYGIIDYKNREILAVKYTEITRSNNSYMTTYVLRNGEKYGLLKVEFQNNREFVDALFPLPVAGIIKDFAGIKGTTMIFLEKNNAFFCFARPDGLLYYKP